MQTFVGDMPALQGDRGPHCDLRAARRDAMNRAETREVRRALPSLSPEQWQAIADLLQRSQGRALGVRRIQQTCGVKAGQAFAVVLLLMQKGAGDATFAVFHCGGRRPVAHRPFAMGFQPTPWKCPACGVAVQDKDLRYELQVTVHGPVVFV